MAVGVNTAISPDPNETMGWLSLPFLANRWLHVVVEADVQGGQTGRRPAKWEFATLVAWFK